MRSLLPLAFLSFLPFAQAAPPDPYWPQMSDNIALRSIGQQLQNGVGISGTVQTAVSGPVAGVSGVVTNAGLLATNTFPSFQCSALQVWNQNTTHTALVLIGSAPFFIPPNWAAEFAGLTNGNMARSSMVTGTNNLSFIGKP